MVDIDELKSRVYFGLKTNSLSAENWEQVVCQAMGAKWIEGDKYLADGVLHRAVLNIKTAKIKPNILKRKENRDFLSHPQMFDTVLELVQRRVGLPGINDMQDDPKIIGQKTIENFKAFEKESFEKFGCDHTLDIVVRYGTDRTLKNYLVDINISNHRHPDYRNLNWVAFDHGSKSKYQGRSQIVGLRDGERVVARNSSGTGRQQNCYIIYKNLQFATHRYSVSVPIPNPLEFNREEILKEIKDLTE